MIHKIIEEHIDLDQILVVTFTNAAAAEMRERILEAIYEKLEENPEDSNLQRQILLLPKANICTIHSFCLDVIRNYFYEIDISPNFRIGDQAELEILKQDTLEELFENKYIQKEEDFLNLIHVYTNYRGDESLKELVLTIYRYIQSSPFPEEWLEDKCNMFYRKEALEEDFSNTQWGKILIENFKENVTECKMALQSIQKELSHYGELEKFSNVIGKDIDQMDLLLNADSWDMLYEVTSSITFDRWPTDKKVVMTAKDEAKEKRDKVKKNFTKIRDKILIYTSKEANQDISDMYDILRKIQALVSQFSALYQEKKKEKNMIDFNDIEHLALRILVTKDEEGNNVPTEVAKTYQEKFKEIAIDEYQDSNLVQEYILSTISKGNNIFMVGDVKQSIYKFRQARPELFIQKYDTYQVKEQKEENDNLKIQLFKNFRSRKNILDFTNLVFETIMSREIGDILYNEEEYLNLGADFPEEESQEKLGRKTEIQIIDVKEEPKEEEEETERVENIMLEAKFVASQIQQVINSGKLVYDKKQGYRNVTYKDIVVLLRATSNQAPIYEKAISDLGMPVFSDTSSDYLESIEIQTIMSLLKIIDNPMQDIPMVAVLRSSICGLDDNELIEIRMHSKHQSFYESLLDTIQTSKNETLTRKIRAFLVQIEEFQAKQEYLALDELIWNIYLETGYYHYVSLMPNGKIRQANLKMLFERAKQYESASFKGLFNFINFIDKLKLSSGDLSSAKLIGENDNVIRIMSIHKSKGLEFPIVFLCGTGKTFNFMDLNQNILLHQELGFGPKYMDYERKIEYNTLAKEAIKEVSKIETLSEEMRILYVALTRAKEQLYITGISKDYEKQIKEKEELLKAYEGKEKLTKTVVKKYKSYLDWIELVYLKEKEKSKDILEVRVYKKEQILPSEEEENVEEIDRVKDLKAGIKHKKWEEEKSKNWKEKLEWSYYYQAEATIPAKTSVTKIKLQAQEEELPELYDSHLHLTITEKPKFMEEQSKISNSEKGTLMHLCMQKLNVKKEYDLAEIKTMIEDMVLQNIITQEEARVIDIKKIEKFTQNTLWKRMKKAKEIYKEQPFFIHIPANTLYPEVRDQEEKILVQGIIDLYFVDEQDHMVLVDYKTDYIKESEQELIEKYHKQLAIYRYAIEEATNHKVEEVYLYSTYWNKEIKMDMKREEG